MSRCVPLTLEELKRHPLPPVEAGDKDAHGKLLLIAGSRQTAGSALIAATAALRSGCGKVHIATIEPMAPHLAMAVPEALLLSLPMGRHGGVSRSGVGKIVKQLGDYEYDAVVAGPGMNQGKSSQLLTRNLLEARLDRLVLDAAMLYALPPHDAAARSAPTPILLPHDREMAALIGCDVEEANRKQLD